MNYSDENLGGVEKRFSAVLQKCNIDDFISVETVKKWIIESDGNDEVIGLLSGLLDEQTFKQKKLINELLNAIINLTYHIPLDRLEGKNFKSVLEKRKKKGEKTDLKISKISFPPVQWRQDYHEAIECMNNQDFIKSCEKYDETFNKLLSLQTTDREIYRVFCNAGLAYLFSGKESLGVSCLEMACELNPKYSFAFEQLDNYEKGDFDPYIQMGFITEMEKNIAEFENDPSCLKLDTVMEWSEKKILDTLASLNVKVDKEEFIKQAKLAYNPEDVAKAIFYPQTQIRGPKEDFIWMAAYALWDNYCPDEPNIDDFNDLIYNISLFFSNRKEMNKRSNKFVKRSKLFFFKELKTQVYADKEGFLEKWKKIYDDRVDQIFDLSNILIEFSSLKLLGKEVLKMKNYLNKQIPHPDWETVEIIYKIRNNDSTWKKQYNKISKDHPFYCYVACKIADYYTEEGEYENAEIYLNDALKIVDYRAEKRKFSLDTSGTSIYEDYTYVFDMLDYVYDMIEIDSEEMKIIETKIEEVESKYELFSKIPEREHLFEKFDKIIEEAETERLNTSYAVKYYDYLSSKDINFETDDEVLVDKIPIHLKPEAYNLSFYNKENELSKIKNQKK